MKGFLSLSPSASLASDSPHPYSGRLPLDSSIFFTSTLSSFLLPPPDLSMAVFCLQLPGEFLFSADDYSVFFARLSWASCKPCSGLISHSAPYTRHFTRPGLCMYNLSPNLCSYFTWDVFIFFFCLSKSDLWLLHLNKNQLFPALICPQNLLSP